MPSSPTGLQRPDLHISILTPMHLMMLRRPCESSSIQGTGLLYIKQLELELNTSCREVIKYYVETVHAV